MLMLVLLFARQAEASRMRWKREYIELPLLANPMIPSRIFSPTIMV
jgi:hypothetical protein